MPAVPQKSRPGTKHFDVPGKSKAMTRCVTRMWKPTVSASRKTSTIAGSEGGLGTPFQPSLPYKLSEPTNLFIRPAIPAIFSQDVPQQVGGFSSEGVDLGDIGFDFSVGKTLPGGVVLLAGLAG